MAGVTRVRGQALPLARATSLESWLDLSGAPTCAPDLLRARAVRALFGTLTLVIVAVAIYGRSQDVTPSGEMRAARQ